MHVFVTRGGELCALVGPICDNDTCTDCAGWAALESGHRVEAVTVADRPDLTPADIEAAATRYLQTTGWHTPGTPLTTEHAVVIDDMTTGVTVLAASYPAGARLRATFDRATDEFVFTDA